MVGDGMTCGQLLRQYRQAAGITQEALAERSGYSANYLSKLERDQRQPPPVALDRLAEVLGLGSREREALRATREQHAREPHHPASMAETPGPRDGLPPLPLPP